MSVVTEKKSGFQLIDDLNGLVLSLNLYYATFINAKCVGYVC